MKLKELIEKLNEIPDKEKFVVFPTPDGYIDIDEVNESSIFESAVVLSCNDGSGNYSA